VFIKIDSAEEKGSYPMTSINEKQAVGVIKVFRHQGRALLVAQPSFNIRNFLLETLNPTGAEMFSVDLAGVKTSKGFNKAFSRISSSMSTALAALNRAAEKHPVALIIDRFDSLSESDAECFYIAEIRSQLERINGRIRKFSVFFTATDSEFVARIFGPPRRDASLLLIPMTDWPIPEVAFSVAR
jgi:hypothetical protein